MATNINRLSARKVSTESRPGLYPDGGGLYLQVRPAKAGRVSKSWLYRFMLRGKSRDMGLGSLSDFTLSEVREKATEARKLVKAGIDPIEDRNRQRLADRAAAREARTFKWCSEQYISAHGDSWRNPKHRQQWVNTLATYAYPIIGARDVAGLAVGDVLEVLEPIWSAKTETAKRIRGRIEAVLDWASVRGYRQGDNPARWRGHLDKLLPAPARIAKPVHHAAMPYEEIGAFMAKLRKQEGIAACALQFLILTATRTSETIGADRGEVDARKGIWTIPGDRMKAGAEHRVPLTDAALAIVQNMPVIDGNPHIFPGDRPSRSLSNMAMSALLKRMGVEGATVHGFRSAFRDWAAEQTAFPREVAERALAHTIGNKTQEAYQRGDLFEKRRKLMEAWTRYCNTVPKAAGNVTPIRKRTR